MNALPQSERFELAKLPGAWTTGPFATPTKRVAIEDRPKRHVRWTSQSVRTGPVTIDVTSTTALDVDDLGILLALMRIPDREAGHSKRSTVGGAAFPTLEISTSLSEIAKLLGRRGGHAVAAVTAGLGRLMRTVVTVTIQSTQTVIAWAVISAKVGTADGRIVVNLHPHAASVLLADKKERPWWAQVDLIHWAQVRSAAGRALLLRLSGWLFPGKSGDITLATLVDWVWGPDPEADAVTVRKRRKLVRDGLSELNRLSGWDVTEDAGRMVHVHRLMRQTGTNVRQTGTNVRQTGTRGRARNGQ